MADVTYSSYLKVDELLQLQQPLSDGPEHDELLFIVIHQSYELWFKSMIHEMTACQSALEANDLHRALALVGRVRTIMKTLVSKVDILETMTPLQFNSFRDRLESSSGFQSGQFRVIEAMLGRRDGSHLGMFEDGSPMRTAIAEAMSRSTVWDGVLTLMASRGHAVPTDVLSRDRSAAYEPDERVQAVVEHAYRADAELSLLFERFVDLDEGLQEWRYRHVKMVERTIGTKIGTGGSPGRDYLVSTIFKPVFPDLWAVRNRF